MKISIVTVTLNAEGCIERNLASVTGQDYPDIEQIIVDGGSVDGTPDAILRTASRVTSYMSEQDRGISDAFNKGIRRSSGDVIGILNADDWYEPSTIAQVVQVFSADPGIDLVCGKVRYWLKGGESYVQDSDPEQLRREMTINHPTIFFRRSVFERIGGFDVQLHYAMDYEWVLRAKIAGMRFHSVNSVLANMSLGGVSDRRWYRACWDVYLAKKINGVPFAFCYYLKQLIRSSVSRGLRKVGLGSVVKVWRARFSMVKKYH